MTYEYFVPQAVQRLADRTRKPKRYKPDAIAIAKQKAAHKARQEQLRQDALEQQRLIQIKRHKAWAMHKPRLWEIIHSDEFKEWYRKIMKEEFNLERHMDYGDVEGDLNFALQMHEVQQEVEARGPRGFRRGWTRGERNALIKQATPAWADVEAIMQVYAKRDQLNQLSGIPALYAVDHIVPINGMDVCGLHVPNNLRVVVRTENSRKSNRLDIKLLKALDEATESGVYRCVS